MIKIRTRMKLPPETEQTVITSYRAGQSLQAAADGAYVSLSTAHRILKRHGIKARSRGKPRLSHREYELTIRLYEAGLSSEEIGPRFGISGAAVRQRLRLAGHPRRKGGRRMPSALR